MKYFLDSAILDEIKYAYKHYGIDGVTTNPKHIKNSGKPFLAIVEELANWVKEEGIEDVNTFPISIEINPHLDRWEDMVAEGEKIAAYASNYVIKIPCTEQGLVAARHLEEKGVRTNVTLVFSPSQAIPVGRIGAKFVSPFVGWKENCGDTTIDYINDIITIYQNYGFETEIIVAALRNGKQIADAAVLGADIVTCGLSVYQASFDHPFTDYGLNVFRNAWDETTK